MKESEILRRMIEEQENYLRLQTRLNIAKREYEERERAKFQDVKIIELLHRPVR